ncbi:MAG: hypothetical protein K0S60_84 [Evtepia sp.]|jgi:hypothetical protein|nr:hypothetical protein [Evtepia sp.]
MKRKIPFIGMLLSLIFSATLCWVIYGQFYNISDIAYYLNDTLKKDENILVDYIDIIRFDGLDSDVLVYWSGPERVRGIARFSYGLNHKYMMRGISYDVCKSSSQNQLFTAIQSQGERLYYVIYGTFSADIREVILDSGLHISVSQENQSVLYIVEHNPGIMNIKLVDEMGKVHLPEPLVPVNSTTIEAAETSQLYVYLSLVTVLELGGLIVTLRRSREQKVTHPEILPK